MATPIDRRLYRPVEAAEALATSRSRIYAEIGAGRIQTVLIGERLRVPASEVERLSTEGLPALEKASSAR